MIPVGSPHDRLTVSLMEIVRDWLAPPKLLDKAVADKKGTTALVVPVQSQGGGGIGGGGLLVALSYLLTPRGL